MWARANQLAGGCNFLCEILGGTSAPGRQSKSVAGSFLQKALDFLKLQFEKTLSGLKIVVVDDHRDAAKTLAVLRELGRNELPTIHDGEEALEKAAAFRRDVLVIGTAQPQWA